MTTAFPATLLCDFYKLAHRVQYPEGTECVYSTWIPRTSRLDGVKHVVAFGMQAFVKGYLIEYFNEHFFKRPKEDVVAEYVRFVKYAFFTENPDASHIAALHDLGYLPLKIKAVKEGTLVPVRVPMATVESTHKDFYWLTNYIETLMSSENWIPATSATIAFEYRKLLTKYAKETGGDLGFVDWQAHDFSMRGMALEAGKLSGAGHLTSFTGTDTVPAIFFHEKFYNANIETELVGSSVNATEHSVMCAGGKDDEFETYRRLIQDVHPKGILSIVSDTWDLWYVLTGILPKLKNLILDRDGKVVIRPDSGDPVKIICGDNIPDLTDIKYCETLEDCKDYMQDILVDEVREETPHGEHGALYSRAMFKFQDKYYTIKVEFEWNRYDKQYYFIDGHKVVDFAETTPTPAQLGVIELLWNLFGGKVNEKSFKELDPHIGAIYGDSITLARAKAICEGLKAKGFASTNIVFGIGSFTYQYNTRDTFGFAMKATAVTINGEEKNIIKDPITDDGTKKSLTGRVVVLDAKDHKINEGVNLDGIFVIDGLNTENQKLYADYDLLEDVFVDGKLVRDESLSEIRNRLRSALN
jgi:nicotinamide phosphoribosyltransferase